MTIPIEPIDPRDAQISALEARVNSERQFSDHKEAEGDRLRFEQSNMRKEFAALSANHELWKRKLRDAQEEIKTSSSDVARMNDIIMECSFHEGHGWWYEAMLIIYAMGAVDARKVIDQKRVDFGIV